jgi:hypothetical protein
MVAEGGEEEVHHWRIERRWLRGAMRCPWLTEEGLS